MFCLDGGTRVRYGLALEEGENHFSILLETDNSTMNYDFKGDPKASITRLIGLLDKMLKTYDDIENHGTDF